MADNRQVAHYTTWEGLLGIIESAQLWATHYKYLNDYSETALGFEFVRRKFIESLEESNDTQLREFFKKQDDNFIENLICAGLSTKRDDLEVFITSFSEMSQDIEDDGILSQWRCYGHHEGFAIVFDEMALRESYNYYAKKCKLHPHPQVNKDCTDCKISFHATILNDVMYTKDIQSLEENAYYKSALDEIKLTAKILINSVRDTSILLREIETFNKFHSYLMACMTQIKHAGFQEEREVRFSCFNRHKDLAAQGFFHNSPYEIVLKNGAPRLMIDFYKSAIKKIIIGPQHDQDKKVLALRYHLNHHGYQFVEIKTSTIPYRKPNF